MSQEYSDFIRKLPQADLPMDGVTGFLLSAPKGQVVFFEIPAGAQVPPHSHGAQWGIVVEGELELTIGGNTRTYTPGDSYAIASGEEHLAVCKTDCRVIDVFADPDRYQAK
ncbi:MAG: cupin domain-containing protein [Desulfarculaceae bacterium]|jgi:quercetin dioxygenase-like cupin family protein